MNKSSSKKVLSHDNRSRYRRLAESPFVWGAIGMIAGATISVLPMRDFFVAGGLLISWGCTRELRKGEAAVAALVVAVVLSVFYHKIPKPPTTDQLAEAIATRIIAREHAPRPGVPPPPTGLTVTVKQETLADVVAEKVLRLIDKNTP